MFKEHSRPLKIEEVALIVGVSIQTINYWYRWKKQNPENELAKLLPDYVQEGNRQTRYWKQSEIFGIIEFRSKIPKGRKGFLGDVTQKAWRTRQAAKKEKENGKKDN